MPQITDREYQPIAYPNQLVYGKNQNIVIVSGWTPKELIAKIIDSDLYAAIGQLYSPARGIDALIRNLLHNPQINYVIAINATKADNNAGACRALGRFFTTGVTEGVQDSGEPAWIIDSTPQGYIGKDIPLPLLEELRSDVKCSLVSSKEEALALAKLIMEQDKSLPTRERLTFLRTNPKPQILPGSQYGHIIEAETIADAWVKILHRIKSIGTVRPTGYDGHVQELINLTTVITNEPRDFYLPNPNYLPCDRTDICNYLPQILEDAPYTEGVKYTYGQRLRSWFEVDQIEQVIAKLIKEIDAASAVMSIWDAKQDHTKGGSPCLNHIWLRVVDNELSLTATFRSNDMFNAWVLNAFGLRALQRYIRDAIAKRSEYDLTMGALMTISQSAHIYDDCWQNADQLLHQHYFKSAIKPMYNDTAGNFLVSRRGDQVVVERTFLDGSLAQEFVGKNPLILIREIAANSPTMSPDHALYLGMEIQKAFVKIDYVQDK